MGERWWSAVECVAQWAGIFSPGVVTSPLSNDWGLVTAAGSVSSPRFRWVASPLPPLPPPPPPPVPLSGVGCSGAAGLHSPDGAAAGKLSEAMLAGCWVTQTQE